MKGSRVYHVHSGTLKWRTVPVLIVFACMAVAAGAGQSFDAAPGTILRLTDDIDTQEIRKMMGITMSGYWCSSFEKPEGSRW